MINEIPHELPTENSALTLSVLTRGDAAALHWLIGRNTEHLGAHGDYLDMIAKTPGQIEADLAQPSDSELQFAMRRGGEILGVVTLIAHKPGVYGLGYWLGAEHTGRGVVTMSCRALIDAAAQVPGAREIWAGITHGNEASIAVVTRLGLTLIREQATHVSFMLSFEE